MFILIITIFDHDIFDHISILQISPQLGLDDSQGGDHVGRVERTIRGDYGPNGITACFFTYGTKIKKFKKWILTYE